MAFVRKRYLNVHHRQVKEQQMKESGTDIVLTGEKLKVYVGELRNKSLLYKQRRLALNDLKAEFGILSRTLEILRSHETSASDYLVTIAIFSRIGQHLKCNDHDVMSCHLFFFVFSFAA